MNALLRLLDSEQDVTPEAVASLLQTHPKFAQQRDDDGKLAIHYAALQFSSRGRAADHCSMSSWPGNGRQRWVSTVPFCSHGR